MIKEHVEKQKDAEFKGIMSRVTTGGRYKPNWIWQKTNGASSASENVKETKEDKGKEAAAAAPEPPAVKSDVPKKKIVFKKNKTKKNLKPADEVE
jgi:hypothetical protein